MKNMQPTLPYAGRQVKPSSGAYPTFWRDTDPQLRGSGPLSAGSAVGTDLVTAVDARVALEILR